MKTTHTIQKTLTVTLTAVFLLGIVKMSYAATPVARTIGTCAQLQGIGAASGALNDNYTLTTDIDCSTVSNFTPIAGTFIGTLNGAKSATEVYKIKNLTMNQQSMAKVGLFTQIGTGATISNLEIENVNITGSLTAVAPSVVHVGALAGVADGGTITNVKVSGKLTGGSKHNGAIGTLGGLIGNTVGVGSKNISQSSADVDLYTAASAVGGLVGYHTGGAVNITSSHARGKITTSVDTVSNGSVGGLFGYVNGPFSIDSSYAKFYITVNTPAYVGGLTGRSLGTTSKSIVKSYADIWGVRTGTTTGQLTYGGLMSEAGTGTSISNSYASGQFDNKVGSLLYGGLIGNIASNGVSVTNSYATYLNDNPTAIPNIGGVVGNDTRLTTYTNVYYKGSTGVYSFKGNTISTCNATTCTLSATCTQNMCDVAGQSGFTTAQLMDKNNFNTWDFTNTWQICKSSDGFRPSYPSLKWENRTCASAEADINVVGTNTSTIYQYSGFGSSVAGDIDITTADDPERYRNWSQFIKNGPEGTILENNVITVGSEGKVYTLQRDAGSVWQGSFDDCNSFSYEPACNATALGKKVLSGGGSYFVNGTKLVFLGAGMDFSITGSNASDFTNFDMPQGINPSLDGFVTLALPSLNGLFQANSPKDVNFASGAFALSGNVYTPGGLTAVADPNNYRVSQIATRGISTIQPMAVGFNHATSTNSLIAIYSGSYLPYALRAPQTQAIVPPVQQIVLSGEKIEDMAFSRDGQSLIVSTRDGSATPRFTVRIYTWQNASYQPYAGTWQETQTLVNSRTDTGSVFAVAGNMIALLRDNTFVCVYKKEATPAYQEIYRIPTGLFQKPVAYSLTFLKDAVVLGQLPLTTAGTVGTVHVYNLTGAAPAVTASRSASTTTVAPATAKALNIGVGFQKAKRPLANQENQFKVIFKKIGSATTVPVKYSIKISKNVNKALVPAGAYDGEIPPLADGRQQSERAVPALAGGVYVVEVQVDPANVLGAQESNKKDNYHKTTITIYP